MRRLKLALKIIGILFGLVLLFLVGVLFYLETDSARKMIQSRINRAIPGSVEWKSHSYSLLSGKFEIRNLAVRGPLKEEFAGFERLFLEISLLDLLGKDISVDSVILEKPRANLVVDENGKLNLLSAFPAPGPKKEKPEKKEETEIPDIVVREARIVEGNVRFEAKPQKLKARVRNLNFTAGVNLPDRSGSIDIGIGEAGVDSPQITTSLDRFQIRAVMKDGKVDPVECKIGGKPLSVALSGNVKDASAEPVLDLDLDLDVSLADIRKILNLEQELDGNVDISLRAEGNAGNPELNLALDYGGGNLAGNRIDNVDLDLALDDRVLTIGNLNVKAPVGEVELRGSADLRTAFPDGFLKPPGDLNTIAYELALKQDGISLGELVPGGAVKGSLNAGLTVRGRGTTPDAASVKASLEVNAKGLFASPMNAPIDAHLKTDASFAKGLATLERLELKTGALSLISEGRYDLNRQNVSADIVLHASDLGETLKIIGVEGLAGKLALITKISGTPKNADFNYIVNIYGNGLRYGNIAAGDLGATAELNRSGVLTISRLEIYNRGSSASGGGTMKLFSKGYSVDPAMPFDFSLALRDVEVVDFLEKDLVGGFIDGNIALTGDIKHPQADISLVGRGIVAGGSKIGDVNADLEFAGGTVDIEAIRIQNGNSALLASGTANILDPGTGKPLKEPEFDIDLTSDALFVQDFLDTMNGKFTIAAKASGTPSSPVCNVSVGGEGIGVGDITIGNLGLDAGLDESGLFSISRLRLENQGSVADGKGSIRLFEDSPGFDPTLPLDFTLSLSDVETKDFVNKELASGKLEADIRVEGSVSSPKAVLSLKGKNLAVEAARLGAVNASVRFENGELGIKRMDIRNKKSALRISGNAKILDAETMKPLEDPEFSVDAASKKIFVQDFVNGFEGEIALDANIRGSAKRPVGKAEIRAKNLDLGAQKIMSATLDASLDGGRVDISALKVSPGKDGSIEGSGWYAIDEKAFEVRLKSDGLSLKNIDKVRESEVADGTVLLDVEAGGTVADPVVDADLKLTDIRVNGKETDDFLLSVGLKDQLATLSGKQNFTLDGQFHLKNKDFSAEINFDGTKLSPYFRIAGKNDLSGAVTGAIRAEGNADAPDRVRASVDLSSLALFFKEIELVRTDDLKVSYIDKKISIPGMRLNLLKEGLLKIDGEMEQKGQMNLSVKGDVPLTVVRYFVDDLPDIEGKMDISADLSGKADQPDIKAEIELKNIALTVPQLGQKLHGLNGRILAGKDRVEIKEFAGRLDEGGFSLTGSADLEEFKPSNMWAKFTAEALPLHVPETMDMRFNADVTMAGNMEKSSVSGEITILDGEYYKDVNIDMKILEGATTRKRKSGSPPSASNNSLLKNMEIDIVVKHRDPFLVNNDLASLDIKPDVRIAGSLGNPVVSGRAEVSSGSIFFRGKTFDVKKGVIDFLNPYKIEPTLDIKSDTDIRGCIITLAITGTPDELNMKFGSKKDSGASGDVVENCGTLDHADILSLIVFDKTASEMIDGEGGESQSTEQLVAEMIASTFGNDIKKAAGLDILEVEARDDDASDDRVKVTIGKELSRRITVKYNVDSQEGETVQTAIAEYKFMENVLLKSFQDSEGRFGGELKFRMEFR